MPRSRIILALAIAPLAPTALWGAYFLVLAAVVGGYGAYGQALSTAAVVAAFAYAHLIVLGIPTLAALWRFGRLTQMRVLFSSALVGAAPYLVWALFTNIDDSDSSYWSGNIAIVLGGKLTLAGWISYIKGALLFAGSGISAGLLWWRIVFYREHLRSSDVAV